MKGGLPQLDASTKTFFESLVPVGPRVEIRPMFGNVAAFLNGHMFAGVLGDTVFVRLEAVDREEFLRGSGSATFEPVKGRPMREYVTLPAAWGRDEARARSWIERSIAWVATFPPKKVTKRTRPASRR